MLLSDTFSASPSSPIPASGDTIRSTFTEAARVMAARLLSDEKGETDLAARAWVLCLSRQPSEDELRILTQFHQEEIKRFTASPADAQALLTVGAMPVPKDTPAIPLAAATSLCRALLNLHEAITRY